MERAKSASPLRGLHPQVLGGGTRAGLQLAARPARGLRSVHRKPAGGRVEANQGRLRRWRHFGRNDGASSPATAAGRHPRAGHRCRSGVQGGPAHPLLGPLRPTIQARLRVETIPMWVATNSAESRAIINVGSTVYLLRLGFIAFSSGGFSPKASCVLIGKPAASSDDRDQRLRTASVIIHGAPPFAVASGVGCANNTGTVRPPD